MVEFVSVIKLVLLIVNNQNTHTSVRYTRLRRVVRGVLWELTAVDTVSSGCDTDTADTF